MENILVAGANGTTGKKIVAILNESNNFHPIAMVRKEEQQAYFKAQNIETVLGDLEGDLSSVFNRPIDKVVFAAGSGGKNVLGVDQEGAKKLIDASKKANIKKFVMLSSMGADKPEEATQLQEYLKAKHNADEYLKTSGLDFSIVRPGSLTNEAALTTIELEGKLNKQGEISREDVAQTLVQTLDDTVASKATFEIIKGETMIGKALEKVS
ncbi:SDR family oxidoreductase [Flavobacterium sandaracinum]|uniref:SDR family oxidoreductase n=1 Tax=Flavobacterium sandaracinum TaxID=2541733 RepID=A0A4R5D1Y7_9FLAO|nr:SDR family oxidoreductase [Flavobacterium sandaracinum]TDE07146.1 SDR family oxidoreductase [Flavobacterium sandaracinum]